MLATMGGGPGKDHELLIRMASSDAEPWRWNRGAWIRLAIAVTPLVAIAIVGIFFVR
jgi:hypothetical protein